RQPCVPQYFTRSQFAAARFHRRRMVKGQTEAACSKGHRVSRPISKGQHAIDISAEFACIVDRCVSSSFRVFETRRDGAVVPRVVQLMAAVGHVNQRNVQTLRRLLETARLIAELASEKKNALRCSTHTKSVAADPLATAALGLASPIETNWSLV